MSNIIEFNNGTNIENIVDSSEYTYLAEISEDMLSSVREKIADTKTISMPITELALLGAGVSSLIPAFRTFTETTSLNAQGLYRLANGVEGATLKKAKDGKVWGAMKTLEGKSKMAKFKEVGEVFGTETTTMPIDPATLMIAVALFTIEQQLKNIENTQKKILSTMEIEKESKIESYVDRLMNILSTYKATWDNERNVSSNHFEVTQIKGATREHMISYKKEVSELLNIKKGFLSQSKVNNTLSELQKKFKYYRLALYVFAMSSFVEILLSGNYKEDYITAIKNEIEKLSLEYRNIFTECSIYLEKISSGSLETNMLKGIGVASKAVGKVIGSIPVIKEGQVDEFLQENGEQLEDNVKEIQKNIITSFATLNNPGTRVFVEKMEDMIHIYNHTSQIYFDGKKLYLTA